MNREALLTKITKEVPLRRLADAPFLYMPLSAYRGHFARPVVSEGERVLKYQLIAGLKDAFSANVHAPVSGTVAGIRDFSGVDGEKVPMLVLQNDFQEECVGLPAGEEGDPAPEAVLQAIEDAGIVGAGGAQFPAALKYRVAGENIDTFIINGVECEPYLTADYAVMRERTEAFLEGIRLVNLFLRASKVVIAIEEKNRELETVFAPFLAQPRYAGFRVKMVSGGYPQGSQWQLVRAVTGLELAPPQHSAEKGIVVSNVATVYAVWLAVMEKRPVVSRILTVSGEGVEHPGNVEVPIGTPVGYVLEQMGVSPNRYTIVLGGPMMGRLVTDWSSPVTKGTNGVLVFERQAVKRENCIGCGRCIDACPMRLMPLKYAEGWRLGNLAMMERHDLSLCVECGACESVCPSNVPLMASIVSGKARLRERSPS